MADTIETAREAWAETLPGTPAGREPDPEAEFAAFAAILDRCCARHAWFAAPGRGEMADVELFAIYVALARAPSVRRVFESGTFHGRSTAVLAAIAEDLDLELVSAAFPRRHPNLDEIERLVAPRVTILAGPGELMIREMPYDEDFAVVVDGPKAGDPRQGPGWQALMRHCLFPRQRPCLVFNHDMRRTIAPGNFHAFAAWFAAARAYMAYEYALVPADFLRTWNPRLAPELHAAFAARPLAEDTRSLAARGASNLCIMTRVVERAPAA